MVAIFLYTALFTAILFSLIVGWVWELIAEYPPSQQRRRVLVIERVFSSHYRVLAPIKGFKTERLLEMILKSIHPSTGSGRLFVGKGDPQKPQLPQEAAFSLF